MLTWKDFIIILLAVLTTLVILELKDVTNFIQLKGVRVDNETLQALAECFISDAAQAVRDLYQSYVKDDTHADVSNLLGYLTNEFANYILDREYTIFDDVVNRYWAEQVLRPKPLWWV